ARKFAEAGDRVEAARLYQAILHSAPGDAEAVVWIVNDLMQQKNQPAALEIVSSAIKAKPDYQPFETLKRRVAVNSQEAFQKYQDEEVAKVQDPLTRTIQQADLAMQRAEFAEADKRLNEAEKIGANDPRVLVARVQFYLVQRKFDQVAPWVERAAAANADRLDGLAIRTRVALQRGDASESLKWANALVTKYGEFAANWCMLGQAQQHAGQYRDA